jgi:MFS-type transporter involved in bile tolerance (Atg22 family)
MFDFANSSYTTVIVTVVFSVIFPRLIVGDGPHSRESAVERRAVGEQPRGAAPGGRS